MVYMDIQLRSTGAVDVPANGVLIKFEIKLPSTVTESFDVTLQDKSQIGVDTRYTFNTKKESSNFNNNG